MQKSTYVKNAIRKISAKEKQLEKISAMIIAFAPEVNVALEAKLTEQKLDRDKLEAYAKRNLPKVEPLVKRDATEFISVCESQPVQKLHSIKIENLCNNLYKKIILKVHPDKNTETDTNDFIVVKNAFDKRDAYKLITISERLGISSLEENDEIMITLILEKKLNELKKEINGKKSTMCYQYMTCENAECFDCYILGFKTWCLEQENAKIREENKEFEDRLRSKGIKA